MFNSIKDRINKRRRYKEWRKRNTHNKTECVNSFNMDNVSVGNYSYGQIKVLDFGGSYQLSIGSFCSIASGVVFNLSGDHPTNRISTFPFKAKALDGPLNEASSKGNIVVGDDVWIAQNAIILSGVTIGQGAVIAAGAVVTHDVPPYSIVGGMPAKVIKYRFDKEIVDYLLTLDYSSLSKDLIESHIDEFYVSIEDMSLDEIKKLYSWFPHKES